MSLNPLVDSRDVRFVLFEMLELEKLNRFENFKEFDKSMYDDTLNLAEKIAIDQFYSSNADGDKTGLKFDAKTHEVKVPESFHKGFKAYVEAGFHSLPFPQEEGGMGMPTAVSMAASEYFNAGNTSLTMYCGAITGVVAIIAPFASEEVKKMYLPKLTVRRVGRHDVPDRTGRRYRRRSSEIKGGKAKRRHVPYHRSEDIHQQR